MDHISIIPLGGACEVGANSYFVRWLGKYSLLLDCGLRGEGPTLDAIPAFHKADGKADFLFVTHAHGDHLGALPYAAKFCVEPNGLIFMTPQTRDIAALALRDTGKIMQRSKRGMSGGFAKWQTDLYSPENIANLLEKRVKTVEFGKKIGINDDFAFTFSRAGHVAGAAMVTIEGDGHKVLYTGDISVRAGLACAACELPEGDPPDILICEGTSSPSLVQQSQGRKMEVLADAVNRAAAAGTGVVVPAFALGRTQEILLAIGKLKKEKKIRPDLPLLVSSGLASILTSYYAREGGYSFPVYKTFFPSEENKKQFPKDGFVYIATSGFFTPGSAAWKAANIIKNDKDSAVIFPSGYARQTGGFREWADAAGFAGTAYSLDFSAHASFNEIEAFAESVKARLTVFVHGQGDNLLKLSERLKKSGRKCSVPVFNGEEILFRKKKGDSSFKFEESSSASAYIITVGESLTRNMAKVMAPPEDYGPLDLEELTHRLPPGKSCAEIASLLHIKNLRRRALCLLISSDGTRKEGDVLAQLLLPLLRFPGYNTVVPNLDPSAYSLKEKGGLTAFVTTLCRLLDRYPLAEVIVAGGLKLETALAYMFSMLLGRDSYYRHEHAPEGEKSLVIPGYPVRFDTQLYAAYEGEIEDILNSDWKEAFAVYKHLPPMLKNLFVETEVRYELTALGVLLRYTHRKEREMLAASRGKVSVEEGGFIPELWETPCEAGAAPSPAAFRHPQMRDFILRLSSNPFVTGIVFEKARAAVLLPPGVATLELGLAAKGRLKYRLSAGSLSQYVTVSVFSPAYLMRVKSLAGLEESGKMRSVLPGAADA